MRLFAALMPPPAVLEELDAGLEPLRAEMPSVRWTRMPSWHLTLAFLGSVHTPQVDQLIGQLSRVAAQSRPIQLGFAGAGRFGQQVLWTGVAGNLEPLGVLAGSVRAGAGRVGIEVGARPYHGHLTLARGSDGVDLRPLAQRLRGYVGSPWVATDMHLVRSHLGAGPGGTARHDTYTSWPLGRPN